MPNIHHVELDITYTCGYGCHNCNRLTHLLPGRKCEETSVGQVRHMLDESVRLGHKWKRMSILGGEPTLHPHFIEVVRCVVDYQKVANPGVEIQIGTNGVSGVTRNRLAEVRGRWPTVRILDTKKTTQAQPFTAITLAPRDRQEYAADHQYCGCKIAARCGLGFNYNGYYCCAIAGAIDRVFRIGTRINSVADLKPEAFAATYNDFCSKCGHYGTPIRLTETAISTTWRDALKRMHG